MSLLMQDVQLDENSPTDFLLPLHCNFLKHYVTNKKVSYEQLMVEYLKMSGIYWTTTALQLIDCDFDKDVKAEILNLIRSCVHSSGGIQPAPGHDPHLLYTLSAIQILVSYDVDLDAHTESSVIDPEQTARYIASLQNEDGSFSGDTWGEVDVRFTMCALASLALLKRLDAIELERAIDFVMLCYNDIDGAFGSRPNTESHSGLIYCCVGSLAIAGQLHRIDADQLGWWLAERQLPSGGLNGRPEKLPDLCYSWWVLSSLTIIGRLHWIDKRKLLRFILACQDTETGGFADRPGNVPDPFHTVFGIAGLSLLSHEYLDDLETEQGDADRERSVMGQNDNCAGDHSDQHHQKIEEEEKLLRRINVNAISESIRKVNPVFCMLDSVIERRGVQTQRLFVL